MTPSATRGWPYAVALALVKVAIGFAVLRSGFHAISDDDFARIVVAQRFAEAPSLDPSGTSWLPLPFWIYGAALKLFGSTPLVARATSIMLGVLSVLVLFEAGRALRLRDRAAFAGAALAAVFPYSAYLGVATVPEAPTAALTVFGAAAVAGKATVRWVGAAALSLAAAARYEPWAAALAFAALSAFGAWKERDARRLGPALLALVFPALWMIYGVVHHGNALFFVSRVTAYHSALGLAPAELGEALARTPLALLTGEPELVLSALAALAAAQLLTSPLARAPELGPFFAVLGAIALMLVVGDARGSAPTHHGERALLPLWFGAALALGAAIDATLERSLLERAFVLGTGVATALLGPFIVRPMFPRDGFAERTSEFAIGEAARRRGIERLVIDTPDFGFFAVQAAFGAPNRTRVLDDHDPRRPRGRDVLAEDPRSCAEALAKAGYRWLALPVKRAALLDRQGTVRSRHGRFALLELDSPLVFERAGSTGAEPTRASSSEVGR